MNDNGNIRLLTPENDMRVRAFLSSLEELSERWRKYMNRLEYLTQLRRSLEDGGLAEDEINDAMGFYEEIFLDAGAAHEAETAANLGSPEELANKILQDSGIHPQGDSVFQMEPPLTPHRLVILTIMCHRTAILFQSFLLSSSQAQYGSALCVSLPQ